MTILFYYLALVNLFAFFLMGIDKYRAKKNLWRIPEKRLFAAAVLGGSLGSCFGMWIFRHKTRHWYFIWGMPLIFAVQTALLWFWASHRGLIPASLIAW